VLFAKSHVWLALFLRHSPEGAGDAELVGNVGGLEEGGSPGPLGNHVAGAQTGRNGASGACKVLTLRRGETTARSEILRGEGSERKDMNDNTAVAAVHMLHGKGRKGYLTVWRSF
jgi:hypothetical protein